MRLPSPLAGEGVSNAHSRVADGRGGKRHAIYVMQDRAIRRMNTHPHPPAPAMASMLKCTSPLRGRSGACCPAEEDFAERNFRGGGFMWKSAVLLTPHPPPLHPLPLRQMLALPK